MTTATTNNQNFFSEITQANVTLRGSNATIPSEMAALQKIVATLAQQVYTMATNNNNNNNNISGSGVKQNTYVHRLSLPPRILFVTWMVQSQ